MDETTLLEDHDDDTNLVRDLRAQLRKAKAAAEAEAAKVAKFEAEHRQSSLAQILASKNIPAKVAKLIPQDVSDEDGVNAWLGEYGDVFGIKAEDKSEGAGETPVIPGVDPAALAEFMKAQNASHEGETVLAPGMEGKIAAMKELSTTAKTMDEFIAGLNHLA